MRPFSDHEMSRIKAALLQRFLTTEGAYREYLKAFKSDNDEGYSRDVYSGIEPHLLYTYCGIGYAFHWASYSRAEGKSWAELNSESTDFIESEYKKIDKWARTSVIAYDIYRFLGHEVFAAFVANAVRRKSILDVDSTHQIIFMAFGWKHTFEGQEFWQRLHSTFVNEFNKSEAIAL